MSDKIIVVFGITGNQGGSVASIFVKERGWKVRGITRDATKDSAQAWTAKGAEVVSADLDDVESLKKACQGAYAVFGNTDFWVHYQNPAIHNQAKKEGRPANELAYEREVQQGKNLIEAIAATPSIERLILSTLSDTRGVSKGRITHNLHFDAKWAAVEYLKSTYSDLWKKTSLLQLGIFATNWKAGGNRPRKMEDGTFKVSLPMSGDKKLPIIDPTTDTGPLVKALLNTEPGKNLIGAGSFITWTKWCEIFSRINNVTCTYEHMPRGVMAKFLGPELGREIEAMFLYINEFGYDGSDPTAVYPWDLGVKVDGEEGEGVTSLERYIGGQDWSEVLAGD